MRVSLQFVCAVSDLNKVRGSLEGLGLHITSAGLEFVTRNHSCLDQEQMEAASSLIEALTDLPDVVRVWDNIQADSWDGRGDAAYLERREDLPSDSFQKSWKVGMLRQRRDTFECFTCGEKKC